MSTHTPTFSQAAARLPACFHCSDVHDREEYLTRRDKGQLRFGCPTCGRWFRPTDRLSVFYELYDLLSLYRCGTHIDKIAASLLRAERGTRELVGLCKRADRALFLNTESRTLVAVHFDHHGVSESVDETLTRAIRDAESWLVRHGQTLLWTHPRYRCSD